MKMGRILGLVVGAFIVLAVLVLGSVWLFVDPNSYKPMIAAAVKDATGRELLLQGDIHLSLVPWIALQVGPSSLGNPPGIDAQPLVSFQQAAIRMRLLPLFAGRLEASRITITDARVSYGPYEFDKLNIETGAFAPREPMPVTITFTASRGVPKEEANTALTLNVSADVDAKHYHVDALTSHGTVTLAGNVRPVRFDFTTPSLDVDLKAQTLDAPTFELDLAGAHLRGRLEGRQILDAMALSGAVTLAPLVIREYLPRLGLAAPATRDPKALSLVSAAFAFGYGDGHASLEDLKLTVDDTHVTGSAEAQLGKTRTLRFALDGDAINLDRYLPPAQGADVAAAPAAARGGTSGGTGGAEPPSKAAPLEVNGSLSVGAIQLAPLNLTAVAVTLSVSGGVVHLFPLKAAVDGGEYSGNIVFDERASVPVLTLDEHLTGIEVGQLVSTGAKHVHASGRGTVTLRATGHGVAADALIKTLNGRLDAAVNDGALEGIDVGFQLDRAEALLRGHAATTQDTHRTPFETLKMTAQIEDGVAQTHDLTLISPVLKVTGQGSVDLASRSIDLALVADTLRMAGNTPIQIPLSVTGSAADPLVRPDLEALVKGQLGQKLKDVLKDKLKGLFNR
jgi:AsmA protein